MKKIIQGHVLLFGFYFRDGMALIRDVARAFDPLDDKENRYRISRKTAEHYNARYEELRLELKRLVAGGRRFVPGLLVPVFAIRLCCLVAAAFSHVALALGIGLLQLVVAPYSFFAGIAAWVLLAPAYVVHYSTFAVLQTMTFVLFMYQPALIPYCHIVIGWPFILSWFVADQLLSLWFCFWSPWGKPVAYPARKMFQSAWYGFLNCKTYWLLLLLCLRDTQLDVLAIVLFALLMPTKLRGYVVTLLSKMLPYPSLHWTWSSAMFYHYHRMVHLPGVYNQSHRPHHFLHDATPFDANLYGTGLPEEWLKILTEVSLALLVGLVPLSFSPLTIRESIFNRLSHTRLRGEHPTGDNFHVNHHVHYQKNFGKGFPPVDMLLGTEYGDVSSMGSDDRERYVGTKEVEPESYVLLIRPVPPEKPG